MATKKYNLNKYKNINIKNIIQINIKNIIQFSQNISQAYTMSDYVQRESNK